MPTPQTTSFKSLVHQLERKFEQVQADALTQAKAELNAKLAQMLGTAPTQREASVKIVKSKANGHQRRKSKIAIKYRDGENTWTGRGRMPRWLTAKIAVGAKREDFSVSR